MFCRRHVFIFPDKWWPHDGNGPIFFYTGNEGDIVDFWDSAGFIFDLAPSFHALVIFAEHVSGNIDFLIRLFHNVIHGMIFQVSG